MFRLLRHLFLALILLSLPLVGAPAQPALAVVDKIGVSSAGRLDFPAPYEVAIEANTGHLFTFSPSGTSVDTNLGMRLGTSPSITALPAGGYEVAIEANTGHLYTYSSSGAAVDTNQGMQLGTDPSITATALVLQCQTDGNHWYASAESGYPSLGTRVNTTLPMHWSVNRSYLSTTDEAAWILNNSNLYNSIEGGYFSGYWPYGGGPAFQDGLQPYYTLDNGGSGWRQTSFLTAGSNINMDVVSGSRVNVGPYSWPLNYSVSNGVNYSQGEVTGTPTTWMGGGAGEDFTGYWTPNGANWYLWGYHNDCSNAPYWIRSTNGQSWSNGGY